MARKLKRNKFKLIFIPVIIVVLGILLNAARVQIDVFKAHSNIRELERKAQKIEQENASIFNLIESSLNDPVKIEREARARLNLKKPDEEVVILIPENGDKRKENNNSDINDDNNNENIIVELWNRLFNR